MTTLNNDINPLRLEQLNSQNQQVNSFSSNPTQITANKQY